MRIVLCLVAACLAGAMNAASPPAPTGLSATASGTSGQVQLSWQAVTAVPPVTGYHVYHNSVSILAGASTFYVGATSTVVSGLPNRALRWFFVASDESGVGPGTTGTAASATPFQAPDAPLLGAAVAPYSTLVTLTWSAATVYGSYLSHTRIESVTASGTSVVGYYPAGTTSTTLTLGCGAPVTLQARAFDVHGSSSTASSPQVLELPCPPVLAATGLLNGALQLAWTPVSGGPAVSAWELRMATGPGFSSPLPTLVTVTAAAGLSAALPAPSQGQGLWARVHGVDALGRTTAASNEVALLQAPAPLTATTGKQRVQLQWSAPVMNALQGVTAYQVHYATFAFGSWGAPGVSVLAVTSTGAVLGGLSDHTPHWFGVAAQGGSGSAQVGPLGLTLSATPGLPSPVFSAATALSGGALSFNWGPVDTAPSTPAVYRLSRSFSATLSAPTLLTATSALSVSSVAAPSPGTVAWYFLSVSDSSGASSTLTPTGGAVLRLPALATPVLAQPLTGNARVTLSWQAVAEATGYQVYRATFGVSVGAGAFTALAGGQVTGTEAVDTAPVNGTPNVYRLVATVPVGLGSAVHSSEMSLPVTANPGVLPGLPGRYGSASNGADLGHLTAVARSGGGVDLRWTAAANGSSAVSGYRVWRGYSPQSLSVVADLIGADKLSYSDPQAPLPLSALFYGVAARDLAGAFGPRVLGTVASPTPWPAPQSLAATVLSGGVRLSWAAPASQGSYPLSSYAVTRRWQATGPYDAIAHVTVTAYTDLNPDAGQGSSPSYRVLVYDQGSNSGAAASLSVTLSPPVTAPALPSSVSGVTAVTVAQTGTPVSLAWRPNPESEAVSAYRVYRDAVLVTVTASVSYQDSPGLGSAPTYKVQALNAQGAGVSGTASPAPIFVSPPQPQWVSPVAAVDPNREGGALGLRLSWQDLGAGSQVDAYRVYAQTGAFSGLGAASFLTETTASSYEDVALSPAAQVAYAVLARSGAHSSASPVAQLSLVLPAAPAALGGLSAVARADGAWLGWSPQNAAAEYWVFRSSSALAEHPPVSQRISRTALSSYSDAGLTLTGIVAHYAVAAVNGLGRGSAASLTVSPLGGSPASLSANAGYEGAPVALLAWTTPTPPQSATGYKVWRATSAELLAAGAGTLLTETAALAYTAPLPLSNTAYYFGVAGFNLALGAAKLAGPLRGHQPPSTPTGLRAVGANGAVGLAWAPAAAHEGVSGWAMSLNVTGNASVLALPLSPSAYTVTGLGAADLVSFSVRALSSAGASPWSITVSARASAAGAASPPLSFTARSGFSGGLSTQANVLLTWSAPGAGSLIVYRSAAPMALSLAAGGASSLVYLTTLAGSAASLTDTVTQLGAPLAYAISAVGAAGLPGAESSPSLAGDVTPYRAPSALALSGTAGDGRVDLAWSPPSDKGSYGLAAAPYRLQRQTSLSAPAAGALVDDSGFPKLLSVTAYSDLTVENGATYWYQLSSIDAAGNASPDVAVTRGSTGSQVAMLPQGPPRPPEPLLAVAGDRSVSLRWVATNTAALNGVRYNVYRRLAGGDYGAPLAELYRVGPSSTEFVNVTQVVLTLRDAAGTLSPPANTVAYAYSVSAINAFGEGPKGAEVLATPYKPLDPGSAGAAGRALSIQVVGKKNVSLAWGATPSQAGNGGYALSLYRVYRSQDGGNTYALVASLSATAMVDSGTSFGAAYTYRVVPVDTMGNEGYSYNLQTVVIPAAVNSVLLFRNAFDPSKGELLPVQFGLQQAGRVWIKVFTLNGEHVATLFDEEVPSASPEQPFLSERKHWDGRNSDGQLVASGVYLIHMEAPGFRQNARVAVIK